MQKGIEECGEVPGWVPVQGRCGWKPATKRNVKTLTPRRRMLEGKKYTEDTPPKLKMAGKGSEYRRSFSLHKHHRKSAVTEVTWLSNRNNNS